MNKSFFAVLCSIFIVLSFVLVGCNNSDYNVSTPEFPTTNSNGDKGPVKNIPKNHEQEDLSVVKDKLNKRVDSLNNRMSDLKSEFRGSVENIGGKINKANDKIRLFSWLAFFSLIVSIVVLILVFWLWRCEEKRNESLRRDLKEIKKNVDWHLSFSQNTKSSVPVRYDGRDDFEALCAKVRSLEVAVREAHNADDGPRVSPTLKPVKSQDTSRKGYFVTPIKESDDRGYFKKEYEQKTGEIRFEAEINGNYAKFRPIDKIENDNIFFSSDSVDLAVDIDDSACARNEVKHVDVISWGCAELRNNRWYITKKAELKLKK